MTPSRMNGWLGRYRFAAGIDWQKVLDGVLLNYNARLRGIVCHLGTTSLGCLDHGYNNRYSDCLRTGPLHYPCKERLHMILIDDLPLGRCSCLR